MVDNLRPDLIIEQVFVNEAPIVLASPLPPVFYGINRQMVWRGTASNDVGSDYIGGQANNPYDFPDLIAGATVELPTAETVLQPHVYLQNTYGISEVTPTYNWLTAPPTFSLSATLSAVFEIASGTTGSYSAASGRFVDTTADFIDDGVADGDIVLIGGVPSFTVTQIDPGPPIATGVVSDDELNVVKIDKGPGTFSGNLTIGDANDDRVFTDTLVYDFGTAGVKVGDLIAVSGWSLLVSADGMSYTVDAGGRTATSELATWVTDGAAAFVPGTLGTPASGSIAWLNNGTNWIPTFHVDVVTNETTLTVSNIITAAPWPPLATSGDDVPFEIYNYNGVDLTGGGVYQDATGGWTTAGLPPTGTWSHITPAIDYTVILGPVGPVAPGWFICVHDADGRRPVFAVNAVLTPLTLTVTNIDQTNPPAGIMAGQTFELWQDTGAAISTYLGATVSIEDAFTNRTLILDPLSPIDFTTVVGLNAGDIVYDESWNAYFTVVSVDGAKQLTVTNITAGSPAPGWTTTTFGFAITDVTNVANLSVTNLNSDTELRVRNVGSDPSLTTAYTNLSYTISVANTLSNIDYTIEKTLTGSSLTGTVLCTYTARRNDFTSAVEITDETLIELLGPAVPANPLALGCSIALQNTNYSVLAIQVDDDTTTEWTNAMNRGKTDAVWGLCPLTQTENVLSLFRTHVEEQSDKDVKRERVLFQSHLFSRVEDRTAYQGIGDSATIAKTQYATEITFTRDIEAYGVLVGDDFSGTAAVLGTDYAVKGRILSITSGATTVLVIVNDNGLPTAPPPIATSSIDWTVKSKDLTDAQYADKISDYPATIGSRRVRNVYPDSIEIIFTDDSDSSGLSGFYGGGDVTSTVPGYYAAAAANGLRGGQNAGQPLTQYPCIGINKLLNPFGDPYGGNEELNDRILNGGNWLMSQAVTGGESFAVRAITTDISSVYKLEDSVTAQIDNFARLLRQQIRPLMGRYNIGGPFFDLVSTNVNAVITTVVDDNKDAKSINFVRIFEDPDLPDTFGMDFEFVPFVSAAKANVTIYI